MILRTGSSQSPWFVGDANLVKLSFREYIQTALMNGDILDMDLNLAACTPSVPQRKVLSHARICVPVPPFLFRA